MQRYSVFFVYLVLFWWVVACMCVSCAVSCMCLHLLAYFNQSGVQREREFVRLLVPHEIFKSSCVNVCLNSWWDHYTLCVCQFSDRVFYRAQCWWMCILMIFCGWSPCGIQTALFEYGDELYLSFLPPVLYDFETVWWLRGNVEQTVSFLQLSWLWNPGTILDFQILVYSPFFNTFLTYF